MYTYHQELIRYYHFQKCEALPTSWPGTWDTVPLPVELGEVINLACTQVGHINLGAAAVTCSGDDVFIFPSKDTPPKCSDTGNVGCRVVLCCFADNPGKFAF